MEEGMTFVVAGRKKSRKAVFDKVWEIGGNRSDLFPVRV
jgi:hypothetical protein